MNEPITRTHADRILAFLDRTQEIENLSDAALSDLVIEKVWGQLNLGSEEDMLLNEMINRFDAAKGIERDDEGEVVVERELTAEDHAAIEKGWKQLKAAIEKPHFVIRFKNGHFHPLSYEVPSLPDATRYATREEAQAIADTLVEATVVEVADL